MHTYNSVTHSYSLLLKECFLVFGPDVHELARFVDLHGVIHQSVHVDKLHSPLLRIVHHGRNDRQLPHLLLIVLQETQRCWCPGWFCSTCWHYSSLSLWWHTHNPLCGHWLSWCILHTKLVSTCESQAPSRLPIDSKTISGSHWFVRPSGKKNFPIRSMTLVPIFETNGACQFFLWAILVRQLVSFGAQIRY